MADPAWEDFDVEEEEVTEEEAKDIESGGMIPIGVYLCRCVSSTPKQIDFQAYSTLGVKLSFVIEKVLELSKMPPNDQEQNFLTGKIITDEVAFANPSEKAGMAKRRKYVALKLGLVQPGQTIKKSMWQNEVVGKKVILRVVDGSFTTKDGTRVEKTKVDFFDGYESPEAAGEVVEKAEEWDDI